MSLTPGLSSTKDLLAKLTRDAVALEKLVSSDQFFNFVITGYSLIDWVKNDPSVSAIAKADIPNLYNNHSLKICGDLANGSKHFVLDRRTPITQSASAQRGFGIGRYGVGAFGIGEESITIQLEDGTSIDCLDCVRDVVSTWQQFFATYDPV